MIRKKSGTSESLHVIGKNLPKVDAMAKVTGETLFADDLFLPRMLYAKALRSPHAHARIVSIDISRAESHPEVRGILLGKDLPTKYGILPVSQDEEAIAVDRVRYVGEMVAVVAATTEWAAEEASELIDVVYEPLESIMTVEEGLDEGKVQIHEYADHHNIHKMVCLEFGDVDAGFEEADHIREDVFFYEGNTHLALEQHAAVAHYRKDGKLTLWSSTQTPHYVHRALSKVLEMPASRIRVIATPNGGGFGGKTDPFGHEMAVSKLAMLTGRPVKFTLTREEVFYAHRGRHPVLMWARTGFASDGAITSMHFRTFLDGGGYGSYGVASTYYTGALQTVTYKVPHYRFEGVRVFTNKPPCGPKRGHGTPQPRFALEVQLDKAAEDLGICPISIRRDHLVEENTLTANYLRVTTCGLDECIDRVVEASGWREKKGKLPPGRGLGLACSSYLSGAGLPIYWNKMPHSGVQIKIDRGGGVAVFCGSTDVGQGSDSVLAYTVAEVLGVTLGDIQVFTADTDMTPVDLGSYSSRVTLMTGNAAIDAATKLRDLLFEVAAEELDCEPDELDAHDNRIFVCEDSDRGLDFIHVARKAEAKFGTLGSVGSYTPPPSAGRFRGAGVGPSPCYSYAACVMDLSVDPDTGQTTIHDIWLAYDCGTALNPVLVVGQVEGSVYMGLGEALMEEQIFRRGVHKIPSLLDYKSPTFKEMPPVHTLLVERWDPRGPFGAKEAGQGPLLPVPPAYVNALYDATGVRFDRVPVGPDLVLEGLERKRKGREPRVGPKGVPAVQWQPLDKVPLPSQNPEDEGV
ncbi:MAG: molybdopterin-dependent oxidoreductase [Planctomycetota bacterium]|nr:molybdopterin-dependent oxidoreductase [Planctomycetota bacterium]